MFFNLYLSSFDVDKFVEFSKTWSDIVKVQKILKRLFLVKGVVSFLKVTQYFSYFYEIL